MISPADVEREVRAAEERVRGHVRETYLDPSPALSEEVGAEVHLKLENLQPTGSFKVRGALNKLSALDDAARARGVVAASTGNHGAAVAWASRIVGCRSTVFVPDNAAPTKLVAMERLGATIQTAGSDCVEAERAARAFAEQRGMEYVSPYNDLVVVAGQGTIGAELAHQLSGIDFVFASLGGGGLISGIASALLERSPTTRIVGVSPENSNVMIESMRAGEILDLPSQPTLSDGSSGGIEAGAITFPLVRELVHDTISVTEAEIAHRLRWFVGTHHMLIEGAAAAVLAGVARYQKQLAGKRAVAVMCGANIGTDTLAQVLA